METKIDQEIPLKKVGTRPHFSIAFKREIVEILENGVTKSEIKDKHGIPRTTLIGWLCKYGSIEAELPTRRTFKPTEKRSILRAYKLGMSLKEIQITYRVLPGTVKQWLIADEQNNKEFSSQNSGVTMAKSQQYLEIEEITALKAALDQERIKVNALETMIDIAEEQFKIEIRKKYGAKQSPK